MRMHYLFLLLAFFGSFKCYSTNPILFASNINDYKVMVNGKELPLLMPPTHLDNNANASFGYFSFSDSAKISITAKNHPSNKAHWTILPFKDSINYHTSKNNSITFKIFKPSNLTLILNEDYFSRAIHLFSDSVQTNIPKKDTPGTIYFGPGYHEISPENNNILNIESNQSVYIAEGAIVKGCIHASNAENIKIYGRGILYQDTSMTRANGIDIESCDNVKIEGIIINRNHDNWAAFIYKSDNIVIDGIKVFSSAIWRTNGINVANCKNVAIRNTFCKVGENNIAIKGLGNHRNSSNSGINPNDALPNENITITNCTLFSFNSNAFLLGQETFAEYYRNITISDCEVLTLSDDDSTKAALAIISTHATDISQINFNNIVAGPSSQLITVQNSNELYNNKNSERWPGAIHNITFNNIRAYGSYKKNIRVYSLNHNKTIENIYFNSILVNNDTLTKESDFFDISTSTNNIIVNGDTIKKAGIDSTGFEIIKK